MPNDLAGSGKRWSARGACILLVIASTAACDGSAGRGSNNGKDTVAVWVAASLTNAIRPQLDSFAARNGTTILTESGGSMEHVRKITELQRVPDLLILADAEVFGTHLAPKHITWWADFATNRMVVAYTAKSKGGAEITDENWFSVLARPGIEVGRGDPVLAPVGYRTLELFKLAEVHYGKPGLAGQLLANAPARNIRPNAAELAALLAAGELDFIYEYESVARAQGFQFLAMPPEVTGRPVTYAASIPTGAPHAAAGARLLEYIETPAVRARLKASYVDMLDRPVLHGTGAPAFLTKTPD